ncbi:MAG: thioredoxin domain-containing protein [Burkholderiales bacterium]|nr:thioredoxin domain-containing protein [Burkholderiales bacterium]
MVHRTWLIVILALAAAPMQGLAAGAAQDSAQIEALIKRLEDSGALDAAVDRGIQRQIQRQQEAQREQRQEQQRARTEAAKNARKVDSQRDRIFGNPQAEVSVIVYDDLECPYCKRFAGTPEQAIAKFDGRANVVFRHFPLDFHGETAKRGAYYAECVGRQADSRGFFIFANTWLKLTNANGKGLQGGDAQIREIAQTAGAKDVAALDACARDPAVVQLVREDIADGMRSGITGTPGVIVRNNKTGLSLSIVGAVPAETLVQGVQKALKN